MKLIKKIPPFGTMKKSNRKIVERAKSKLQYTYTWPLIWYKHFILPILFWSLYCLFFFDLQRGAWVAQWVRSLDLTTHTSLSPIWHGFTPSLVNYKKECTWLAAVSDKVYQLFAHGRWFSPGTPASSTTKTGRHDIPVAEILLKITLNTKFQIH